MTYQPTSLKPRYVRHDDDNVKWKEHRRGKLLFIMMNEHGVDKQFADNYRDHDHEAHATALASWMCGILPNDDNL